MRKEVENQAAFAVRDFKSRSNIVRASRSRVVQYASSGSDRTIIKKCFL
ncbi:hypothetical protein [Tychonema sp. LEGE 07203]|nr:hypothetical protein [Tychonema sp. LEGE 07203]